MISIHGARAGRRPARAAVSAAETERARRGRLASEVNYLV
jgi:hypothetical protein